MYRGMCQAANERGYLVTVSGVMAFERIKDTMVDGIIMPNEDMTSYYMKKGGKNYYLPIVSASFVMWQTFRSRYHWWKQICTKRWKSH